MTLDKAIELLKIEYEKSKALKWVRKPIAYSLYQVWKIADKKKDDTFREYNGELIHYIGTKMIEDGLMSKVIIPFLDADGLKAQIGDHWFYFGGSEFEYTEPKEIPFDVLVSEIKLVLDDFYECSETYGDEYLYYYYYLCENI